MAYTQSKKHPCQSIYFWGVRGTMPSPYKKCLNSGGHTSCIEVNAINYNGTQAQILLDAGTGIVPAGERLLKNGIRNFTIYISHFHYDHIFGLTKFSPLFRKDCSVKIIAVKRRDLKLTEIFNKFFSYPFFPVTSDKIQTLGNIEFLEISHEEPFDFNGLELSFFPLNHPQECYAIKSFHKDSLTTLIYATDHEHNSCQDKSLINFVKNSSLLIYDSTYHSDNFTQHEGWGHSTGIEGANIAKVSGCLDFFLFHHDYSVSDKNLLNIHLKEARNVFKNSYLSKERLKFELRKQTS